MENKNMTAAREWENDPNCFLRMLNSPAQQRSRAARRQKAWLPVDRFHARVRICPQGATKRILMFALLCYN